MDGFLIQPPPAFNINGPNVGERFAQYKSKFTLFLTANGLDSKEESQKIAILKLSCGDDLLHQIEASQKENQSITELFQILETYFIPESNTLQHQFKFLARRQFTNETFDKYFIELKKQVKNCNFGDLEDNLMKIALILNVRDYEQQQKFLGIADGVKLDDLLVEFRKYDSTKETNKKKGPATTNDHTNNKNSRQRAKSSDSTKKEPQKQFNNTAQGNKNNPASKKPKPTDQQNNPSPNAKESGGNKKGKNKSSNNASKNPDVFEKLQERIQNLSAS